ncbi:MAG: hypothetical protein KBS84_00955 [Treponema sp.]|nr:hypothetical protein [Candidatus Treponema scatequi]
MEKNEPKKSMKFTAAFLIFAMCFNILPAQEIASSIHNSEAQLEYYLDRAMQERQNEKWESLVSEGLLAAMDIWENENIEALDSDAYESEKQKAEEYLEEKINKKYTQWSLEKERDRINMQASVLEQKLRAAALAFEYEDENGNKTRIVNIDSSEDARAQWNEIAEKIIAEFTAEMESETAIMISDIANRNKNINLNDEETKKLVDEFVASQKKLISEKYFELSQKEENSLMNDVLYDHESLRKASDKEAAAVIASQLAKETETNTDREMKELFDEFQEDIIRGELSNFDLQNSDWFDRFEDALNQSLEAWNNAELKFLQARSDWELNAKEVFISNEEVWQAAFKELNDRKNQWNEKIYAEIAELQQTLKNQRADLESEIQNDLFTYYAMLENQKTSNKKIIMMQESIYNESRSLMAMSQEGIGNWFDHWGEKYNGLYSYWKTEDAATFKLYFGNTTQLENNDLKINTIYTVDSDNNKIYSESESITNLKNQINNWNKAYLAMVIREISKTISAYNSQISSNNSSIDSYQAIIDKYDGLSQSDIKEGKNITSPNNAEQGRKKDAYDFYMEYKDSIESYREKVAALTRENVNYRNKIDSLKGIKVAFENTDASDTDVLRSRLSQLKSFKEIRGITDSVFTGTYKALWNTEDFILGTGSDLTYWATQLEKNTRQTEEAAVELYKKAGYTLTDSGMNELENQYLKNSALEQYWKEQLEIATAVKEYAVNRTSAQEVLSETEANLVNAINAYNTANTEYLATLDVLQTMTEGVNNASAQIDTEKEKLDALQKVLEAKQNEYYAALDAYNGLYGSTVEKSINQIIDSLNAEQGTEENKKTQLDEYYTLLSKQVSITAEQNRQTILKGLTDGIYSPAITEESMDNFSAAEVKMYAELKTSTVLADNFDLTLLNSISTICSSEATSIKSALQLLKSDTTSDADKELLKIYIEANVLNINKAFNREKQKRELAKNFLNGQNIDSNVVSVSAMDMTAAFMDIYFELYVKAGVDKDIDEETKASLDAVKEKHSKMSKEDFNAYLKENRDEPIIVAILNLASFSPEYTCLFNSKYNEKLFALGYESASIVDQVKTGYSEYLISNINEANSKAMTKVSDVIRYNNPSSMNKDQLLNYIVELNMAADGLDDASVSALNLYISELLYNFAYENNTSVDINAVNQKVLDTTAKINEISKWTNYIQNASYIGEILKSDIFASLNVNSELRKQIITQAAYLYLPYVKDLSSKDKIKEDVVFEGISDSLKSAVAAEIEALTKTYPEYEYKTKDEDYEKLDKLYDLTETYFEKEAAIAEIEVQISVLSNLILSLDPKSKEGKKQIENLEKKIAELNDSITEVEDIFNEYVNKDEYLVSVFDTIDFDLTDKDYYLPSIIGRDFLYELLCAGAVNENGNIVASGIDKIDEVNAYLGENKFEDLAHFAETIKYIWSYNELFDGNASDWIDSLEISDDFKAELKDYYEYGRLIYPVYYNAQMQMSFNNGGDKYYKDFASMQDSLFENISALYISNFKEYVKAGVETELNSYLEKKAGDSLSSEAVWLANKNAEIDRNNAEVSEDKKVQKLSIGLDGIQSEKNYTSAFAKYFTEYQTKYDLTSNVNIAENIKSDITEAYLNIYSERNERQNNIAVLKNEFTLLEKMFDDSIEKQQQLNEALKAYQTAENNVNTQKQNYYGAIETYKEKCEDYNTQMAVVQSKYNVLETKRIEKRKADEIKRWADNEYLHDFKGTYNSVAYETPEEMYDRVNEAYTKAKAVLDYISSVKNSKTSTVESKYEKEFNEYTKAYEKYFRAVLLKSEFSAAVAKQEAVLKEAEEKVEKARIELIKSCNNKAELSDAAKKYVVATKVTDGKYKFDIAGYADISTSQLETYYNDEKSYLYTDENENDIYVDLAQADAFSWLLEMEAKGGDELEDLILAAFYLYYKDDSVKETIKNIEDIAKNDPNAGAIIKELHGMNSRSIFNDAVTAEIEAVYNKVINNSEKRENLAKLLLFKDTYLVEENEQLFFRANNVLCRRAYESVKDESHSKELEFIGLSVAMAAVAAGFYACVTIFTPWFLVPAIAATVAAASFAATAHDFASYINELSTQQSAANNNIAAKEKKMNSLIQDYKDAEATRSAERDKLNIMKFGSATGSLDTLDYDAFEKSLKEALKTSELRNDDGTALLSMSYLSEIYDIDDKDHASFKSYYDVVNKDGKEYTSVAQVLSKISGNLSSIQLEKEITLNDKANALKQAQKNAAVDYNNAVLDNISKAKEYTDKELNAKADAAFGNDSWNEIAYQNRLQEFYGQFTDHKYISNKRGTESYIQDAISKLKISYALELEEEESLCYDVRQYKDTLTMQNYFNEEAQIKQQIDQILYVADKEWNEAEKKLNASHNTWLNDFDAQLDEKRNAWTTNYANFLTEKSNYITTQYVYAQNVGNIGSLVDSGIDVEKVLAESLSALENINVENEILSMLKDDMNGYVSTLYNEELLTNLYSMSALANNSAKSYGARVFSGQEKNIGTIDSYLSALKVQDEIAKDMKDNAARLAAEQAETQITKMIEAFMNRIDLENNAMRDWEETLVRNYGYEFGSTIKREAIVDASFCNTIRDTQYVHLYQNFATATPSVPFAVNAGDSNIVIMSKIKNAQNALAEWSERIFGRTDVDENGNEVIKYYNVPRDVAELNNKNEYEAKSISKKELEAKSENDQKAYVSIRDGEFGEYLGYEPEWNSEIDVTKGREANLKSKEIHGEIGLIMLDFQWNEMERSYGMARFQMPVYDKPLWPSGGFFEPPTLRSLTALACDIAGIITQQSWWLGLVDDVLFGAMDLAVEKKDPAQVAIGFAKAVAINELGAGLGALGGSLIESASAISNTGLRIATKAFIGAGTAYTTSAAGGFINAIQYDPENGWGYDIDSALENLYSPGTIASTVTGGVTAGLNAYFNADGTGLALNGLTFDTDAINCMTSLAGGFAGNITSLLMGGDATFNLLSIMASNGRGSGMLEFSIGANGVHARFGTGGTNISINNLKNVAAGAREAKKVNEWKTGSLESWAKLNEANLAGYSSNIDNQALSLAIWNEQVNVVFSEGLTDANGNAVNGYYDPDTNSIVIDSGYLGSSKDDMAKLAAIFGHEGAHMAGHDNEAEAHQAGFNTYGEIADLLGIEGDTDFAKAMLVEALKIANNESNGEGIQYWKLVKNGQNSYDWMWDDDLNFNIGFVGKNEIDEMFNGDLWKKIKIGSKGMYIEYGDMDKQTALQLACQLSSYEYFKGNKDIFVNMKDYLTHGYEVNDGVSKIEKVRARGREEFANATVKFAEASTSAADFKSYISKSKDLIKDSTAKKKLDDLNKKLAAVTKSGHLARANVEKAKSDRVLTANGNSFPMALNEGQDYFNMTTGYGYSYLTYGNDVYLRAHFQNDFTNQNGGQYSNPLIASKNNLSYELGYTSTFGLNYIVSDGNGKYQRLGHMDPNAVMDYIGLVTGSGTSFDGTSVSGVQQNSIVGQTGTTGKSTAIHLDLTQFSNGYSVNPETIWSALFEDGSIKDIAGTRWSSNEVDPNKTWDIDKIRFAEEVMNFAYGIDTTYDQYDSIWYNYDKMQQKNFERLMQKYGDILPFDLLQSYNAELKSKLEQEWLETYQNRVMTYRLMQNSIFTIYTPEQQAKLNGIATFYDIYFQGGNW